MGGGNVDSYALICLQRGAQFGVATAEHHLARALVAVANAGVGGLLERLPLLVAAESEPAVADQGLGGVFAHRLAGCLLGVLGEI